MYIRTHNYVHADIHVELCVRIYISPGDINIVRINIIHNIQKVQLQSVESNFFRIKRDSIFPFNGIEKDLTLVDCNWPFYMCITHEEHFGGLKQDKYIVQIVRGLINI